ncbi:MAG TPA: choice-of-anchor Q domain-containing protein [Solirubrobacteraceae bacterium]|nr:choice-of-anchor Q domain-containing protein [Solirubrobacteraceae bacterium]
MTSAFTSNTAGGNGGEGSSSAQGDGGAIEFEGGTLAITDSSFSANSAGGSGGDGTSSAQGDGGAVEFEGATLTITDSSFSANRAGGNGGDGEASAQGDGGAVEFEGATLTITESSFSANSAGGNGGDGTSSAQADGGALEFSGEGEHATLTITASTFNGNQAGGSTGGGEASGEAFGGAIEAFGGGAATLTNDTIEGNSVGGSIGAVSGAGVGGGGLNDTLPATLLNDTVDGNAVIGASGAGGNIDASPGPVTLKNTIVSAGAAASGPNCTANVISAGHNLESTTPSECGLNPALGDLIGANPLLGPLQSNGGPTQTQALLEGSPAIEAGENAGCPATDQRGVARPQPSGGRCDIGAFEFVPSSSEQSTSEQRTSTSSSTSSPTTGGSPSPSGIATTPEKVEELLLGCSKRELVLNDVLIRGGRVELNGSAAESLDGKKVKIIFDSSKQVATAKVDSHDQFATTAPLPPASIRDSNSARYMAESSGQRSLNLKLNRRLQLENPTFSGGAVSLTGRVLPPLTKPIARVTVEQQLECGHTARVLTFKPAANGSFHVSIEVPAAAKAGIYRLTSTVRESTRSRHGFATYSLPLPVALG